MAGKRAEIFIVDLGSTTADCNNGRTVSDLDYGMRYIWNKITAIMAAERTTLSVGVIGFRTDTTDNALASDEQIGEAGEYENICTLKPLGPMQMQDLRRLQEKVHSSSTEEGDAVSAVVLAIHLMDEFTTLKTGKPGKFERKIVLLTDGKGAIQDDDVEPIAQKIMESGIELVIIGVDFDDAEFGFKEEEKVEVKKRNEKTLRTLVEKCEATDSGFATAAQALQDVTTPDPKIFKPYCTYKGHLTLGDPIKYPHTAMCIDVERYTKTKAAKPVSASSFVTRVDANGSASEHSSHTLQADQEMPDAPPIGGDLDIVHSTRSYYVHQPTEKEPKKEVPFEELSRGYEYGRTAVPIGKSEENITKFETTPGFEILGFIPAENHEKFLNLGESCITTAQRTNARAMLGLSSLIHALHEAESYAVARFVAKEGKEPQILLLAPLIEPDMEALVDVPLPFAEDIRTYRFPPLDRVLTTSGKVLSEHWTLPKRELQDAMSDYVDSMDISESGERDDEGNPTEYMQITDTFSPILHRINQAIRERALNEGPVGPPAAFITKYSQPPASLVSKSTPKLQKLIAAADLKKVPPKAKGRLKRPPTAPLSGLDVDALLHTEKRTTITRENSIPLFLQLLHTSTDNVTITSSACTQLGTVIRSIIRDSFADASYGEALANLRVMREQMIEFEDPASYNAFVADLKTTVLRGDDESVGGERGGFFDLLVERRLGLIAVDEAENSDVSREEAAKFYKKNPTGESIAIHSRS